MAQQPRLLSRDIANIFDSRHSNSTRPRKPAAPGMPITIVSAPKLSSLEPKAAQLPVALCAPIRAVRLGHSCTIEILSLLASESSSGPRPFSKTGNRLGYTGGHKGDRHPVRPVWTLFLSCCSLGKCTNNVQVGASTPGQPPCPPRHRNPEAGRNYGYNRSVQRGNAKCGRGEKDKGKSEAGAKPCLAPLPGNGCCAAIQDC